MKRTTDRSRPNPSPFARSPRLGLVAVAGMTFGACASAVFLPDASVDIEIGAESAPAIEAEMGRVSHPASQAWVEAVGMRLVAALGATRFTYRFTVVDQAEANAFALPGGHIYVSRGLLALVRSEAELAGVLAHEIQHVERRHSVKRMQRGRRLGVLSLPGRVAAGIISQDLANIVGAPFELIAASYSRDQETESDVLGQALCAEAGYDPLALGRILDRMERYESIGTVEQRRASFFDSHPTTPNRTKQIARNGATLSVSVAQPIARDDADAIARLEGLSVGSDPSNGFVRGTVYAHPYHDLRLEFPNGWTAERSASFVAATSADGKGVVVFTPLRPGSSAELGSLAEICEKRIIDEYGIQPEKKQGASTGGAEALGLILTDDSGAEPTHVYFVWVAYRGHIFQVIGMSTESQRAPLRATLDGIRPLADSDLVGVTRSRLRVANGRAEESLAEFCVRTANAWSVMATAVANDLDPDRPLAEGAPIKIAVDEPLPRVRDSRQGP